MTTDPRPGIAASPDSAGDAAADPEPDGTTDDTSSRGGRRGARRAGAPSFWHRTHPVFTPLSGFFTGLVVVIVLPGLFGAVLSAVVDDKKAESLIPLALLVFGIPVALIIVQRTRRFGRYMLLGMVLTALVVLAVAALTIFVLIRTDG